MESGGRCVLEGGFPCSATGWGGVGAGNPSVSHRGKTALDESDGFPSKREIFRHSSKVLRKQMEVQSILNCFALFDFRHFGFSFTSFVLCQQISLQMRFDHANKISRHMTLGLRFENMTTSQHNPAHVFSAHDTA